MNRIDSLRHDLVGIRRFARRLKNDEHNDPFLRRCRQLELGYSARTAAAWRAELEIAPLAAMPSQYLTPAIEDRAIEVQLLLADRGRHRAPSIPDIVVAATAELAGLIVLHFDKDFDLIAEVTGQSVERLAVSDAGP